MYTNDPNQRRENVPRKDIAPNQTIYIRNLNEKITKSELRRQLYYLFSQYGPVLDIVALKTQRMRGQAFVVFRDIVSASNALREMQDFVFFEKPLDIQYAKTTSDIIARMEGTYQTKEKRMEEAEEHRKRKMENDDDYAKRHDGRGRGKKAMLPPNALQIDQMALQQIPPNKTLFVQNLPAECTANMLVTLFQKYQGFLEVRLPPGQKGVAFVDYQNEIQASLAMGHLQEHRIDFILSDSHPSKMMLQKSESLNKPLCTIEWLIQSLIHQKVQHPLSHPDYYIASKDN